LYRVEADLKNIYFTNLSGGIGFESLFIFFKLSAFFMVALVGLGFSCFLTLDTSLNSLESLYDN
jgi:hypothetical protein